MKQKRIIVLTLLFTLIFGVRVLASESNTTPAIFMGRVITVEETENKEALRIKIKGYIKGCEVYKDEIIGIITEDTIVMPSVYSCNEDELKLEKVNLDNFAIKRGDVVFCILDEAMTKSIPPQVRIKAIQTSPQKLAD
ncbi:MAG: hypothetical protein Q4B63_05360 [Clostridium perfringens]|nr:hypothetical protein [Clostridium perfringens]